MGKEVALMSEDAKQQMLVYSGLEPPEEEKVERVVGLIPAKFFRAGRALRFCDSRIDGDHRVLDFNGPGCTTSVLASEFFAASDLDAVAMITSSLLD